jgi:hypothetical protein
MGDCDCPASGYPVREGYETRRGCSEYPNLFPRVLKRVLGHLSTRVLGVRVPICIPEHVYLCE